MQLRLVDVAKKKKKKILGYQYCLGTYLQAHERPGFYSCVDVDLICTDKLDINLHVMLSPGGSKARKSCPCARREPPLPQAALSSLRLPFNFLELYSIQQKMDDLYDE